MAELPKGVDACDGDSKPEGASEPQPEGAADANEGKGGGSVRDSMPDLESLPPGKFVDGLEARVAQDPKATRTKHWIDEAKRRVRATLGAAGEHVKAVAVDIGKGGKVKIVLTFLAGRKPKLPSFFRHRGAEGGNVVTMEADVDALRQVEGDAAEVASLVEALRQEEAGQEKAGGSGPEKVSNEAARGLEDGDISGRIAAITGEMDALIRDLRERRERRSSGSGGGGDGEKTPEK